MSAAARLLGLFGINIHQVAALRRFPRYMREAAGYRSRAGESPFPLELSKLKPRLSEYDATAGNLTEHYFVQDLWAARKIYDARPASHLDIGSRIDGFVAHVLTFMPVTLIDIRPFDAPVSGLRFIKGDICNLDGLATGSVASLSSLHATEHVGLGRYGDPLDPDGPFKAMRELARVLAPGGRLYFSVPVGRQRLHFNSERIFDPRTVLSGFPSLRLLTLDAVGDDGQLHERPAIERLAQSHYACGLFEFTKD